MDKFKLAQPGPNLRDRISSLRSHGLAVGAGGSGADKASSHKHTDGPAGFVHSGPSQAAPTATSAATTQASPSQPAVGPSFSSKLVSIGATTSTVKVPVTQPDRGTVITTEAVTAEAVTVGLIAAETDKDSAVTREAAKADAAKDVTAKDDVAKHDAATGQTKQTQKDIEYDVAE